MNWKKLKENGQYIYEFKRSDKYVTLSNLRIYYTRKNIKMSHKKDAFKNSDLTWNDTFDLSGGSCSVSDMQYCFDYIIKKHKAVTEIHPIRIYVNKIQLWI